MRAKNNTMNKIEHSKKKITNWKIVQPYGNEQNRKRGKTHTHKNESNTLL